MILLKIEYKVRNQEKKNKVKIVYEDFEWLEHVVRIVGNYYLSGYSVSFKQREGQEGCTEIAKFKSFFIMLLITL